MSRSALTVPDVRDVPVYIYALCEPVTGRVRYVGKTQHPRKRLTTHLHQPTASVRAWIADLKRAGQSPRMEVLLAVPPGQDATAVEREQILAHARGNYELLNKHGVLGRKKPRPQQADGSTEVRRG